MRILNLDLSEADDYVVTKFSVLKEKLQKMKKYRKDLLYRGFDGTNIPRLLKTGQDTDNELIFCLTEDEITTDYPPAHFSSIFDYVGDHDNPAIAVFDSEHLLDEGDYSYTFKYPDKKLDALLAVFKLVY